MGGINSLGGLNKVNVDFRPAIDTTAPNNANANQPQQVQPGAQEGQRPVQASSTSVVKQLDVLLLNAAVWGAASGGCNWDNAHLARCRSAGIATVFCVGGGHATCDVRRARTTSRLTTCVRRMSVASVVRRKSHVQNQCHLLGQGN